MATMLDQRSQASLPMGYAYNAPEFRDPWTASSALYQTSMLPATTPVQQQASQSNDTSTPFPSVESIQQQQARVYGNGYTSTPGYAPTTNSIRYSPEQYPTAAAYAPYDQQVPRRSSYPQKPAMNHRDSYTDALDASQGMLAMSQADITPRNAYPPRSGSQDAYGFPGIPSAHSSISSASGYPQYYHGSYQSSIDGSIAGSSVTDYSSETENAMVSRPIPTVSHMGGNFHQEQAAMMTQFNSKMSASAQKKHKCKICDKRFTRPSSLQTHMYSHTGEKPFACDFEGCGRHFSVVSNLRRHKKCHRNSSDHTSPEDDSAIHHSD